MIDIESLKISLWTEFVVPESIDSVQIKKQSLPYKIFKLFWNCSGGKRMENLPRYSYRPWRLEPIKQVIHHLADSPYECFIRLNWR